MQSRYDWSYGLQHRCHSMFTVAIGEAWIPGQPYCVRITVKFRLLHKRLKHSLCRLTTATSVFRGPFTQATLQAACRHDRLITEILSTTDLDK